MKITLFALVAGAAVITAGCVHTVSDTNALATTWSQDSVSGPRDVTGALADGSGGSGESRASQHGGLAITGSQ